MNVFKWVIGWIIATGRADGVGPLAVICHASCARAGREQLGLVPLVLEERLGIRGCLVCLEVTVRRHRHI